MRRKIFQKSLKFIFILLLLISISCSRKLQFESYLKNQNLWLFYGKTLSRDFFMNQKLQGNLKPIWSTELEGGISLTSPISIDKYFVTFDLKGNIYFIDIKSGKKIGKKSFGQPILVNPIIKLNEIIIPLAETSKLKSQLIILDILNNKIKSKIELNSSIENEMIYDNESLIVILTNGEIIKLNSNYLIDWKVKLNNHVKSSPSFFNKKILIGTVKGEIYLLDVNGKILHQTKIEGKINSGFSIKDNRFFFSSGNKLYCYDLNTFDKKWEVKLISEARVIPSLDENSIFLGDLSGNFYKINQLTGKIEWILNLGGIFNNSALVTENLIFVPNLFKKLFVIDKITGEILNVLEYSGRVKYSPIIVENILVIGVDDKKLIAYEVQ